MIISDLSHLEDVDEALTIVGGNCSLSVSSVNGKTRVTSSGGRLRKTVKKQGGNTTTTYRVGDCRTTITTGRSVPESVQANINSILAEVSDFFDSF